MTFHGVGIDLCNNCNTTLDEYCCWLTNVWEHSCWVNNTEKTDKCSTSLCIHGYYYGWLLTVSHHIVQVVMVAQHLFCCRVTNFMDDNRYTGIHVLNVTTTIMMANNVNTVQKNYIDQGSEINISSSLVCYRSCLLTGQTPPLYEKESNTSLCPACLSKWKILSGGSGISCE